MTQKTIFINEIFSNPPKKNCLTNKTDVYHIDDMWSLDISDTKDYGPENNRGFRYIVVILDYFSKFGWTVPLKKRLKQKNSLLKKFFQLQKRNKFNWKRPRKRIL